MKKTAIYSLWLLAPFALWAQAADSENPGSESNEEPMIEASIPEVVEIPETSIEGVSRNEDPPNIPTDVQALPEQTEIVLELPGQGSAKPGEATLSSEETISVDFPDEDVRTILRNIADLFELNLVIPDTLQGRTSLKLRKITWQQAFEVVLKPLGFTYVEDRNIIMVKSIDELTTEPVDTRVFVVNYAGAAEISNSIVPLIDAAAGGRVQVDVRSNALVITERPSRMGKIQEIIERLDRPTDQVMIETKFVEVSQIDNADLGVDWAFIDNGDVNDTVLGNSTGGSSFGDPGVGSPINSLVGSSSDGLLAIFSAKEYAATLNALETKVASRLISNPTVVVMNNREATFQVGQDFPIREFNFNQQTGQVESGDLEYRETGIVLNVTPSVNAAGMISLDIKPKIDRVEEETVDGPNGIKDQIFGVQRVETQVTIKDGYTIALGGLAQDEENETVNKIPVLGSLPLFGKLFSSTSTSQDKTNLIIFLTAKTLNPDGTTYREIINPRILNDLDHIDSEVPGYTLSEKERDLLQKAEAAREQRSAEERELRLQNEIENPGASKAAAWQDRVNLLNE